MTTVTRKDLGRISFESTLSLAYFGSDHPPQGSWTVFLVRVSSGEVQYSPYSKPGWRQLIERQSDATTTLIGWKLKVEKSIRYEGWKDNIQPSWQWRWRYSGHIGSSVNVIPGVSSGSLPLAGALAREKFVGQYYDKTRSIRGASTVAEIGSTIAGLASPAKALRKEVGNLYDSLRKRLWRSNGVAVRDATKVIAGTWLEWQYGIRPTVADANGAALAVNRMREGDFRRGSVRLNGSGHDEALVRYVKRNAFLPIAGPAGAKPGTIGYYDLTEKEVTDFMIRGAIRLDTPGGEVPPVMQFGVGFEDIVPAVWEGIPWSFFIDYFVNVSSVIDAWSMCRSRIAWLNNTTRYGRVVTVSNVQAPPNSIGKYGSFHGLKGGHTVVSRLTVLRSTMNPDDLAPPLRVRIPHTGTKWANIAALAAMFKAPGGRIRRHY